MAQLTIHRASLENGLTLLTVPQYHIPKVCLQLWYGVGSKNEASGEKGIAHLIEHLIFKGTHTLSESDINLITHKLSGSCNAFTSHDYTGYLFDLPAHHWHHALGIMADCMVNCTFKEELLCSELKAVIQELKMYNDDYPSVLFEKLMGAIFTDHPYRYPVIGYKKDLWSLDRQALVTFYKKHYVPNNAILVAVGPVEAGELLERAQESFGALAPAWEYQRPEHHHSHDIAAQSITLYRDVQQPLVMVAWVVPGTRERLDYVLDVASWLIGSGKGSRLVRRVVEELELVTELESFTYDHMDHSLFVISFQPKAVDYIPRILDTITEELALLASAGCTEAELKRACKKTELDFISLTEDQERCAYLVGKYFLATGDERYLLDYTKSDSGVLMAQATNLIATYLRPAVMHTATLLPLANSEKSFWLKLQEQSDAEDKRVLSRVQREAKIEAGSFVHRVEPSQPRPFSFPKPEQFFLTNGLKVFSYHNSTSAKITLILDVKARAYFDPDDKQGLQCLLMEMLAEGTTDWPDHLFMQELESYGMGLEVGAGTISMSMLQQDLAKGLALLSQMLTHALFKPAALERVRAQIIADIHDFWDSPSQSIGQIARQAIYGNHPYAKSHIGSVEGVASITRGDLLDAYQAFVTPQQARLAIVGDLEQYDLREILEHALGQWRGPRVSDVTFPPLVAPEARQITKYINRDQVVLAFAGLSVRRLDQSYDKILLFDQILTGGALGSMSSRLFQIREQSGLFYTAGGSLVSGAHREPGMIFIQTIVSPERLTEAEAVITDVLNARADGVTDEELEHAQRALAANLVDHFAANHQIAASFLFLDTFDLPVTFFDKRAQQLMHITKSEVQDAVAQVLAQGSLTTIRIGRLGEV